MLHLRRLGDKMIKNCEQLPFHVNILQQNIAQIYDYIMNGYDVNTKDVLGRTGLYYAIFSGNLDIVKILIQAGGDYKFTDVQFDGVNLLHIASAEDHLDIVKYFVEELNFDVNAVDNKGNSSLFYAILFEAFEIAEYLICHGAKNICHITRIDSLFTHLISRLNSIKKKIQTERTSSFNDIQKIKKLHDFIISC